MGIGGVDNKVKIGNAALAPDVQQVLLNAEQAVALLKSAAQTLRTGDDYKPAVQASTALASDLYRALSAFLEDKPLASNEGVLQSVRSHADAMKLGDRLQKEPPPVTDEGLKQALVSWGFREKNIEFSGDNITVSSLQSNGRGDYDHVTQTKTKAEWAAEMDKYGSVAGGELAELAGSLKSAAAALGFNRVSPAVHREGLLLEKSTAYIDRNGDPELKIEEKAYLTKEDAQRLLKG